jgi:hypothetical protein
MPLRGFGGWEFETFRSEIEDLKAGQQAARRAGSRDRLALEARRARRARRRRTGRAASVRHLAQLLSGRATG